MLKILEDARWLDVLETSPLVAGDARFLREYFLPAHGQYKEQRYRTALVELDRLVARAGSAKALAARGRVRRLLGDREAAGRDFEAALARDPDCLAARAYRGEMRLAADPQGALADLARAAAGEPKRAEYRLWLGYAHALAGDSRRALECLDAAVARDAEPGAARLLRGILRERGERLDEAEEDYTAVIRANPRCPGLYTLRATVRWKRRDFKRSVKDADRAILLHPENLDAFMRIIYLSKDLKHPEEKRTQGAIVTQITDEILARDPGCAWAHALRAEVIEEKRVASKAEKKARGHERAVKADPKNAWMRAFLGRSMSGLRRDPRWIRRGLKELDRAVALQPRIGWIRCWRAEVLEKLGEKKRALRELDRGLADDPDYRLANAWRASLRERLGDDAGAMEDLTACLPVMPRPGFYHQRALLLWRLGDGPAAVADLTRCIGLTTKHALAYSRFDWLLRFEWGAATRSRRSGSLMSARGELRRGLSLSGDRSAEFRLDPLEPGAFHAVIKSIPGWFMKSEWKGLALEPERFEALARAESGDAAVLAWLGRARLDAGGRENAEEALERAAALDARGFAARAWRGEARFLRGDFKGAARDLEEAVALRPSYVPASLWLALAQLSAGRAPEALKALLGACYADPAGAIRISVWARWTIPGFWTRLRAGVPARSLAEFALVCGQYRKATLLLSRVPDAALGAEGWILRAFASGQSGAPDRAEEQFSRAVCLDSPASAERLGFFLKQMPHLRKDVIASAYFAMGEAWALAGREAESLRAHATAVELGEAGRRRAAGLSAALMMRARVKRETGDLQGALEDARRAASLKAGDAAGAPR